MASKICLRGVRVHNLRSIDLELEAHQLILFTGISGSGKSSLAFDTLFAEGQWRYVESLSPQLRRQMGEVARPDLDESHGLTPTIAIEQKSSASNPRSTVATMTELYDYLRLLYARVGEPHCPESGEKVAPQSCEQILAAITSSFADKKVMVLAPYMRQKKGLFKEELRDLLRKGFTRGRLDGVLFSLDDELKIDPQAPHDLEVVVDRLKVTEANKKRLTEALMTAIDLSKEGSCLVVDVEEASDHFFSTQAYSRLSNRYYPPLEPHDFSFNSPSGMCPRCHGLGSVMEFDLSKVLDVNKSIRQDCCSVASSASTVRYGNIYQNLASLYGFDLDTPWCKLAPEAQKVFLYGTEKKWSRMQFVHPVTGATWVDQVWWKGALEEAHERYRQATSSLYKSKVELLMVQQSCPACHGARLKPYPAACQLAGATLHQLTAITIDEASLFFDHLDFGPTEQLLAAESLKEIRQRLFFLQQVGLGYLTLDRTAPSLSGGEVQRVRLASQIGSALVGITYVLDEPSIGLHPRDNKRLIATLKELRDRGNTVVVVEHDEETILAADVVVEMGPGAGARGGRLLFHGPLPELLALEGSPTADYLVGRRSIPLPKQRRLPREGQELLLLGASHHNLQQIDLKLPLGLFIAVTGVSGSGKSSLITDTLYPALANRLQGAKKRVGEHAALHGIELLDQVIAVDQSPIGRNPRSNPATYIKLFDEIRDLFAQLPESLSRGLHKGHFSFNVKEGSCPQCEGMGLVKVELDFLQEEWVLCSSCQGRRFDSSVLAVLFKGKTIYDLLEMEAEEALAFFSAFPKIAAKLQLLVEVGLGYLKLGQSSTTLSGGEAQRIKLAKELGRLPRGRLLYLLDEPTTGLHLQDVALLLQLIHRLVDKGHTVVVIEHNMELVKTADWVVDLGPEGGSAGGRLLAAAPPEQVAQLPTPTGEALRLALSSSLQKEAAAIAAQSTLMPPLKPFRSSLPFIRIEGACQNNLKSIDLEIPRSKITVCTGPSGAGKSSLAFETLYAEGQRRYAESLSPYLRQFVKQMAKPKVGRIEGLSPAIAIEAKSYTTSSRSTVGTMTEIYDYLRLLYARIGQPHCPKSKQPLIFVDEEAILRQLMALPEGARVQLTAPLQLKHKEGLLDQLRTLRQQGFTRLLLDGVLYDMQEEEKLLQDYPSSHQHLSLLIDRLKVVPEARRRLQEAITLASKMGKGRCSALLGDEKRDFQLTASAQESGDAPPPVTPHLFSFNHRAGMCPDCQGLGYQEGADLFQEPKLASSTLQQLFGTLCRSTESPLPHLLWSSFLEQAELDSASRLADLSLEQLRLLLQGSPDTWLSIDEGCSSVRWRWRGLHEALAGVASGGNEQIKELLAPLLRHHLCPSCLGGRLNRWARHVTIEGVSIVELCSWPLERATAFIAKLPLPKESLPLRDVQSHLLHRLEFLCRVGLDYLSLNRSAPTLSGGETQRIRLARQLGTGLSGLLYVIDEPSTGLHPHDSQRLHEALYELKRLDNTLLLVDHNPAIIAMADLIIELGPGGGYRGGELVAQGSYKQLLRNPKSVTGQYLIGKRSIPCALHQRRKQLGAIKIEGASQNNLKQLSLEIPLGRLVCLTGISGSGKSTLMHQVLWPALRRALANKKLQLIEEGAALVSGFEGIVSVQLIDQQPLGSTSRSDVSSYCELLDPLRTFFAKLPEARALGLQPKHFSPNHRQGMCTRCWGLGERKVEMYFLPPLRLPCDECHGMRLNSRSLEVRYQGRNLGEWLTATIDEVHSLFSAHPRLRRITDLLIELGLGYLQLGQPIATLSSGEGQRLKLSRSLAKRPPGATLYLLDEPSRGLHSDETAKLLALLHKLVDKGHSLLLIEHNLDLIRSADWVIDLGPDAGDRGGELVFAGTLDDLLAHPTSWTGLHLRSAVGKRPCTPV